MRQRVVYRWVDAKQARRGVKLHETTTACDACAFPLSHRHHILEYSTYGEHDQTLQLCANCHWMLHLSISANLRRSAHSIRLWEHLMRTLGADDHRILYALRQTVQYPEIRAAADFAKFEADDGNYEVDDLWRWDDDGDDASP